MQGEEEGQLGNLPTRRRMMMMMSTPLLLSWQLLEPRLQRLMMSPLPESGLRRWSGSERGRSLVDCQLAMMIVAAVAEDDGRSQRRGVWLQRLVMQL